MTPARALWTRIGLVYLAGAFALVGFWAAFAPRSFYVDFPGGGRHWVSPDGPYNQHLVRDVGELNLALMIVVIAAVVTLSLPLVRATLVATIVNGVLHVTYHARNGSMFPASDQVAVLATLTLVPLVAIVLLVTVAARAPEAGAAGSG